MSKYANAFTKMPYTGEGFSATREVRFYARQDCEGVKTNVLPFPNLGSRVMVPLSAGTGSCMYALYLYFLCIQHFSMG